MYERFFGLKEAPFSIAPNPHYLYMSQQHHEALAHLVFGVGREGGFVLLTGEVGTGKTTVCRCFLEQIPEDTDVAFILNPKLNSEQLLANICDELSIPYIGDSITIKDYIDCINERLLNSHAKGRNTLLIIDEAQNLAPAVLEQLRLLTNLETHEKKLLQIVLLGQPELQEMFQRPELRQLSQRVTARFHLDALNQEEVGAYVSHRLKVAGCPAPSEVFPAKTIKALFQISKGIPRVINLICDRAMLGAYTSEKRTVDVPTLKKAAVEVLGQKRFEIPQAQKMKWASYLNVPLLIQGSFVALLCGIGVYLGARMAAPEYDSIEQAHRQTAEQIVAQASNPTHNSGLMEAPDKPTPGASDPVELVTQPATTPVNEPVSPSALVLAPPPPALTELASSINNLDKDDLETAHQADSNGATKSAINLVNLLADESLDLSEANAYRQLLGAWGIDYNPQKDGFACRFAKNRGLGCLNKMGSFGSVKHLGLPAVLALYDDKGSKHHVVLKKVHGDMATVSFGGHDYTIKSNELNQFWRGHFVMLWKVPPNYHGPLQPGTIAPMTKWLSMQLDRIGGAENPQPGRSYYDDPLVERVKAFQRSVGEEDDGIVGVNTLIQLSKMTDQSVPRLSETQEQL